MRLRTIKDADVKLKNIEKVVAIPEDHKGKWKDLFKNDNPIYLEIGMGKGSFLFTAASRNKDINYIGLEISQTIVWKVVNNYDLKLYPNVFLICADASRLAEVFAPGEIAQIYLNFSDPWPKKKHSKRRLTSDSFLINYRQILQDGGVIEQKTDQLSLFEYSLERYKALNYDIIEISNDLHSKNEEIVMTDYEKKFIARGDKIMYVKVRK